MSTSNIAAHKRTLAADGLCVTWERVICSFATLAFVPHGPNWFCSEGLAECGAATATGVERTNTSKSKSRLAAGGYVNSIPLCIRSEMGLRLPTQESERGEGWPWDEATMRRGREGRAN